MDMMELDGLAQDVDALFGIDGLKEDLMDVAILGVSAGASVVVGELLFSKVDMLRKQNAYVKAGIAAALGIGGGIALGRYVNRGVGAGVAAGLIGWSVAKLVQKVAGLQSVGLDGLGQSDSDLLLGLGQSDEDMLLGLGQTIDNDIAIRDYRPLPGQTNGLGQAGDVYASDLKPFPGTSGGSGYMEGLGSFLS
jgi:hypothetical protein